MSVASQLDFRLRHIWADQGIQERWWWKTPSIGWADQGGEKWVIQAITGTYPS
ncbi:MAG: hypothetical protein HRU41_38970 [Saprospiraceae bacterium]|nr:hypothetical protein [Saprospiraceae bacterium]